MADSPRSIRPASATKYYEASPQIVEKGSRTWLTRGANFVIATSEIDDDAVLVREQNPDEYMTYLVNVSAIISTGADKIEALSESMTIVPPGASRIELRKPRYGKGTVVRVFSALAKDLADMSANAEVYADGAPEAAPLAAWPDPPGGFRLRNYIPDEIAPRDQRFRLIRCTTMMINVLQKRPTPRDTRKLSPHSHANFEQASVVIEGDYMHHLRYPWIEDMSKWRDDEHLQMSAASVVVIPAHVIHTSRNVNDGVSQHLDIFAPPRADFATDDLFLNATEYPLPPMRQFG